MNADSRTAIWASENRTRDPWTARYVPTSNGEAEPPHPLPYGTTPRWIGTAEAVPMDPPRIDLLDFRTAGEVTEVKVRVASSRRADVITMHADRPVERATITVDGQPPRTASPSYPQAAGARPWPYELRFYDPPPNGFTVALQLRLSGCPAVICQRLHRRLGAVAGVYAETARARSVAPPQLRHRCRRPYVPPLIHSSA